MAKEKNVVLLNVGTALQMFRLEDGSFARVLPDEEITLPASVINLPGVRCLIAREEIEIKDDSATNRKIRLEMAQKTKVDPWDKKSRKELEDGGEY